MTGRNRALTAMWTIAVFFIVATAAGLVAVDSMVAAWTAARPHGGFWADILEVTDRIALLEGDGLLIPSVLVIASGLLFVLPSTRPLGYLLLYVGLVQLLAAGIAAIAAPRLGRVPPFEAVAGGDVWSAAGHSFPAATVAFVAGLFFPLLLLMPRLWPVWIVPPLAVAAAVVLEQVHYLSDAAASLALAAVLAAGFDWLAERGRG
jgi:membrane-associated phospholipid phosphatase